MEKAEVSAPGETELSRDTVDTLVRQAGMSVLKNKTPMGDFTVTFLDGTEKALSDFRGSVVFLNFWATWCPPCRVEMPSMERMYQRYKDSGLVFIAMNLQEGEEDVDDFINSYRYTFPVALDINGLIGRRYSIQSIPTTLIIDREGNLISGVVGAKEWDSSEVFALFDALLKPGT